MPIIPAHRFALASDFEEACFAQSSRERSNQNRLHICVVYVGVLVESVLRRVDVSISAIQACIGSSTAGRPAEVINEILDKIEAAVTTLRRETAALDRIRNTSLIHLSQFRSDFALLEASYRKMQGQLQRGEIPLAHPLMARKTRFQSDSDKVSQVFTMRARGIVGGVRFAPDDVSFCFSDGKALFVNSVAGDLLHQFPVGGEHAYSRCVEYFQDGSRIAVALAGGLVLIVAMENGASVELRGHCADVNAMVFSDDGKIVYTGGQDGVFAVWDSWTGERLKVFKFGDEDDAANVVVGLAKHNDEVLIVLMDGSVRVFCGDEMGERCLRLGRDALLVACCGSPDGTLVATGWADGAVTLWSYDGEIQCRDTLTGHSDLVSSVCFDAGGSVLVTGSRDESVVCWSLGDEKKQLFRIAGFRNTVLSITHHVSQKMIVTACGDMTVSCWMYDL